MMNISGKHRGIHWSNEDINSLVNMYKSDVKINEIVHRTGRTRDAVQHKIKNLKLTNRTCYWTNEEIKQLLYLRNQGKSFKEIGIILKKTERAAQGKHIRAIQPVKPLKERKKPKNNNYRRIYSAKDDYFSTIDSQKKAYYIGFILADGYVTTEVNTKGKRYKLNRLGMKLSEKDIDVLYDLRNELCSQVPIQMIKSKPIRFREQIIKASVSCSLHITSEQIVKDLKKYGIVQNKTYTCSFPQKLEQEYYPGFIAGVLSGDGSVGTKPLMDEIRNILIQNIGFNPKKKPRKYKQTFNLHGLELNKSETLNMYHWMKNNGILLMPRKNKIIEDYIEQYPEKCSLQARSA